MKAYLTISFLFFFLFSSFLYSTFSFKSYTCKILPSINVDVGALDSKNSFVIYKLNKGDKALPLFTSLGRTLGLVFAKDL